MKSCIDLATDLNVSKQTIFNNAKKLDIELIKQDNTLYIQSDDDIKRIISRVLNNKAKALNIDVSELMNNDSSFKQPDNKEDTQDVSDNSNEIELLKQMLEDKDKQIQSLHADKQDLTDLLKQQQQLLHNQQSLQLQSNEKIKALEIELNEIKEDVNRDTTDLSVNAEDIQRDVRNNKVDNFYRDLKEDRNNKQSSFLSRLFKR